MAERLTDDRLDRLESAALHAIEDSSFPPEDADLMTVQVPPRWVLALVHEVRCLRDANRCLNDPAWRERQDALQEEDGDG